MSSNHNHINQTINLGNYEEFFILYMDNELTDDQKKMVDEFLIAYPDLNSELQILLSTKLSPENFPFDKENLMAENMQVGTAEEELFLFIDNELSADQKKTVELELASNKNYRIQFESLLKTKLDDSEKIVYPDKKELFHRDDKIISFKPWMRVAAAVVIIAAMGIIYFTNNNTSRPDIPTVAFIKPEPVNQKSVEKKGIIDPAKKIVIPENSEDHIVQTPTVQPKKATTIVKTNVQKAKKIKIIQQLPNEIAFQNPSEETYLTRQTESINTRLITGSATATLSIANKDFINSSLGVSHVTPEPGKRIKDNMHPATSDVAKGSIKGFLRKATKLIEKRTGIDPTNDDGSLLIGAVALKLK